MKLNTILSDITTIKVDAIVNAANSSLLGGSGVDGAIHRKGGTEILEACKLIRAKQGKCKVGEAVITTAGNLPAKYVIHTVGPVWNQGGKEKETLLANCYSNTMLMAIDNKIKTIAFPNISTGIYKFPKELAAKIAIETVTSFKNQKTIQEVTFVCFDQENFELYSRLLQEMKTTTLYRPVGLKELELIFNSEWKSFPPRLNWQPIFYPVMNEEYAIEIATKWNLEDEGSGYSGFVIVFDVKTEFLNRYKIENVGGKIHNELWVPSEELEEFNKNIIGEIRITKAYFGTKFQYPDNKILKRIIQEYETKS